MLKGQQKMKILQRKERGYCSFIEKYNLCGAYAGKKGIPIGVLLLYIFLKRDDLKFIEMTAEAESEVGEEHNIVHVEEKGLLVFKSEESIAELFLQKELQIWEIKVQYQNVDISVAGRTYGTVLSIRTPLTSGLNLIPLMSVLEQETYKYHDYDQQMIDQMKIKFSLNQKTAIQSIIELKKYTDIWEEFEYGFRSIPFEFPQKDAVTVEGYSAKTLCRDYPLSELGAYNYLIYLRNDPENALQDLKQGLPRK